MRKWRLKGFSTLGSSAGAVFAALALLLTAASQAPAGNLPDELTRLRSPNFATRSAAFGEIAYHTPGALSKPEVVAAIVGLLQREAELYVQGKSDSESYRYYISDIVAVVMKVADEPGGAGAAAAVLGAPFYEDREVTSWLADRDSAIATELQETGERGGYYQRANAMGVIAAILCPGSRAPSITASEQAEFEHLVRATAMDARPSEGGARDAAIHALRTIHDPADLRLIKGIAASPSSPSAVRIEAQIEVANWNRFDCGH